MLLTLLPPITVGTAMGAPQDFGQPCNSWDDHNVMLASNVEATSRDKHMTAGRKQAEECCTAAAATAAARYMTSSGFQAGTAAARYMTTSGFQKASGQGKLEEKGWTAGPIARRSRNILAALTCCLPSCPRSCWDRQGAPQVWGQPCNSWDGHKHMLASTVERHARQAYDYWQDATRKMPSSCGSRGCSVHEVIGLSRKP